MNEIDIRARMRSAQESGCVAEYTPRGMPEQHRQRPGWLHARISVCGRTLPTRRLIGWPVKMSLPRLPCSTAQRKSAGLHQRRLVQVHFGAHLGNQVGRGTRSQQCPGCIAWHDVDQQREENRHHQQDHDRHHDALEQISFHRRLPSGLAGRRSASMSGRERRIGTARRRLRRRQLASRHRVSRRNPVPITSSEPGLGRSK